MNTLVKAGLIAILFGILVFTGFVTAGYIATYLHPTTAQGQIIKLEMYLDDTLWANNSDLDWGLITSNETIIVDLDIKSIGELNCTVTMAVTGIPAGWTQTYSEDGDFLESGEWLNGTITLTTGTVKAIPYNWNTIIEAQQT